MSIGTLLAYTIVSASVIILRYKTSQEDKKPKDGDESSVSTASIDSEENLYLSQTGKLKPEFWWLSYITSGCSHNDVISGSVIVFISSSAVLCSQIHFSASNILAGEWWAILILIFLILGASGSLLVIAAHKQNPSSNTFRVPWVPFIPGLSILCNVGLMVHLNVLTWVRFTVWMILGLLVYFLYGIKHSKESDQTNTYSMLITSSEAHKEPWGAIKTDESTESKPSGDKLETVMAAAKKLLVSSTKDEDKIALSNESEP